MIVVKDLFLKKHGKFLILTVIQITLYSEHKTFYMSLFHVMRLNTHKLLFMIINVHWGFFYTMIIYAWSEATLRMKLKATERMIYYVEKV